MTKMDIDKKNDLIYLASPYTTRYDGQRIYRVTKARQVTAVLIMQGYMVYAPIPMSTHIWKTSSALRYVDPYKYDLRLLEKCDKLMVLMLPGWDESVGVKLEIKHAKALGMSVAYVKADDDFTNITWEVD